MVTKPVLQMEKLRHREVKWAAQGYTELEGTDLGCEPKHLVPVCVF